MAAHWWDTEVERWLCFGCGEAQADPCNCLCH